MSDALRAAAEQAFEALHMHATHYPHLVKGYTQDAMQALAAALTATVAPAVPAGMALVPVDLLRDALESVDDYRLGLAFCEADRDVMGRLRIALDAAPQPTPAAVPSAEPVAERDTVPVPTVVAWSGGAAPYRFVRLRLDDTPREYEYVPAAVPSAEPVMFNGLTEAETDATASVAGIGAAREQQP